MPPLLYASFQSNDDSRRVLICSSPTGTNWGGGEFAGEYTNNTPVQTYFKGKYWGVFLSKSNSNAILVSFSDDAIHWSKNKELPESSKGAPSVAVFKDRIWICFLNNDKNEVSPLRICSSADGVSWTRSVALPLSSLYAPSLTVFQNRLWVTMVNKVRVEEYDENRISIVSSSDGSNWVGAPPTPYKTNRTAALASFNGQLYVGYSESFVNGLTLLASPDGVKWTERSLSPRIKSAPFLAVFDSKLWISYIANQSSNPIEFVSSADGVNWSASIALNQQSPVAVSLFSRWLYLGTVTPKYQVVTVVYAPPGANGGKSTSQVTYGNGSTLGTKTSNSNSFKAGINVKASVGFAGSGGSLEFGYSTDETDSSTIEVKKSKNVSINVIGAGQDGISHDYDIFYLWLNPQLTITSDGQGLFDIQLGATTETMTIQYVYAAWLKNPATLPPGLKATLDKAGLTVEDYEQILSTNPFSKDGVKIDAERYLPTSQSFPYIPPFSPNDPVPTQTFRTENSISNSTVKSVQTSYKVGFSATIGIKGILDASLETSSTLEWTNSVSREANRTSTQEATVTVGGPSFGYQGPTDVLVYWDTVFSSFLFRFPTTAATYTGQLTDAEQKPLVSEPVALHADGQTFTTFTDHQGGFRFYAENLAEGELAVRDKKIPVQLASAKPLVRHVL
jgi:hypothetical protein